MYDPTLAFLLPAARKRAPPVWEAQLFANVIRLRLMPDVILNPGLILACCIDVILTAPKFPIAVFELQIPKLFTDHETALTLQIAHKTRHTHFGGESQTACDGSLKRGSGLSGIHFADILLLHHDVALTKMKPDYESFLLSPGLCLKTCAKAYTNFT